MPFWANLVIKAAIVILKKRGFPYLKKNHPQLAALLMEILDVIDGRGMVLPSQALKDCANGYCSVTGQLPDLKT